MNNIGIINNFINMNFERSNNYKDCIKLVEKLSLFSKKNNYNISLDEIMFLLKTNINYQKCIEIIVNKNMKTIVDGKADIIFKNSLLISSIDIYCMLNNIEINMYDDSFVDLKDMDGLTLYYNDVRKYKLLNYEEEQLLVRKAKQGDSEAKNLFIASNLRLVGKIARMYLDRGLSLQDLIQEGTFGLFVAYDKFNPDLGYRFSTYAYNWIKTYVARALANYGRTIRYPVHMIEKYNKFIRIKNKLIMELNREPSIDEMAKALNMSLDRVIELYNMQTRTTSLDELVGEDKDVELGNMISDPNCNVEEKIIDSSAKDDVNYLLKNSGLSDREIEIIKYRFGVDGYKELTLKEIGNKLNVSRQRVEQIQNRALEKMHNLELYRLKRENLKEKLYTIDRKSFLGKNTLGNINNTSLEYKTIYNILSDYSKSEIDLMISKLNSRDRLLITKVFGDDLTIPYVPIISKNEYRKYDSELLPKMKRLLRINRDTTDELNMQIKRQVALKAIDLDIKKLSKRK